MSDTQSPSRYAYVKFESNNCPWWEDYTGLDALTFKQLELAYARAGEFISEKVEVLVKSHGWSPKSNVSTAELFSLARGDRTLWLPTAFSAFFDTYQSHSWVWQFQDDEMFPISYPEMEKSSTCPEVSISARPPLVDIFYLIQSFAPGMLLLIATDETRGVYVTRSLPPVQWIEENFPLLEYCLGLKVADKLRRAASDVTKSFHSGSVDEKVWPDDEPIQDPLDDDWERDWDEEMEEDWDRYDDEYEDRATEENYGAAEESPRTSEESPSSDNDWHHTVSNWDGWEVKAYLTCSASCGFCGKCENNTPQETTVAHGW